MIHHRYLGYCYYERRCEATDDVNAAGAKQPAPGKPSTTAGKLAAAVTMKPPAAAAPRPATPEPVDSLSPTEESSEGEHDLGVGDLQLDNEDIDPQVTLNDYGGFHDDDDEALNAERDDLPATTDGGSALHTNSGEEVKVVEDDDDDDDDGSEEAKLFKGLKAHAKGLEGDAIRSKLHITRLVGPRLYSHC